ncbi:DNA repair protein RecN [Atopobacter phocae]|uniref:DNA repair protein RecN n=1 Tax=Atopobacter phocae TaxID=136492 RepID=UPI00046F73E4|nr:DNA repair protein RecN [Atopobacter phocae]
MLQQLNIQNFAIIESMQIEFKSGLTILTGETGAGKSIIIDAVGLLLGQRAQNDLIRYGSERSLIQGVFSIEASQKVFCQQAEAMGIDLSENQLIVTRELKLNGGSSIRVNGLLITLTQLKQLMRGMIDIHTQHEHQQLFDEITHVQLLDYFGDEELQQSKTSFNESYAAYQLIRRQLKALEEQDRLDQQQIDFLKFQIDEIDSYDLSITEEQELEDEAQEARNYQQIATQLGQAMMSLEPSEYSVTTAIGTAHQALEKIEHVNAHYKELSENFSEIYYSFVDVKDQLSGLMDDLSYDEERFDAIESRLNDLTQLKRKYGGTIEEVLAFRDESQVRLDHLIHADERMDELKSQLAKQFEETLVKAEQLTQVRRRIAEHLEQAIEHELNALYMQKTRFAVKFEPTDLYHEGNQKIHFDIQTNQGEPFKPLTKIASGGEASRIILALKTIFSQKQSYSTLILDEIDTGVSGRVSLAIGQQMVKIADHTQVLAITHQAQVASFADQHLKIVKDVTDDQRTTTQVNELVEEDHLIEIAKMQSGEQITTVALEHAKELVRQSQEIKQLVREDEMK